MNPDLEKLLDLQAKDLALLEWTAARRGAPGGAGARRGRAPRRGAPSAWRQRGVAEAIRRRIEVEGRVETYRKLQEGRRKRIEVPGPARRPPR